MSRPATGAEAENRPTLSTSEPAGQPGDAASLRDQALSIIYLNISDIVYHLSVSNGEYRFADVNPAFYQVTLLSPDQVIGKRVQDVIPEPSLSVVLGHYSEAIRTGQTQRWEETSDYPAGKKVGEVSVTPVFDAAGNCSDLVGTVHDITALVNREQRLQSANARFAQLAHQVPGALFELSRDESGRINCTYISAMAYQLFELAPEDIEADCMRLIDLIVPKDRSRLLRALNKSSEDMQQLRMEFQVALPRKGLCWREVHAMPSRTPDGRTMWHGFTDDISGRKDSEQAILHFNEKLERRAHYDALTGLPNRALFRDRLEQGIRQAADTPGGEIALLFIDLDRFKEVNDLLGHDAGDALLIQAARRISACVRRRDTVARLGGDEFTVILTEATELAHIEQIAQQILDTLAAPFHIKDQQVQAAGSIGIARYPADARDSEELMRNADHAMYRSKAEGRNQLTFFESDMQAAALRRLKMINDLRRGLPENQFELYFQPIVNLKNNRIVKAEALLRWNRSNDEIIGPADFIQTAEESGLIHEIGDWVFCTAADYAKQWSRQLGHRFQISINKSPLQFQPHPRSMSWTDHLRQRGVAPGCINVEITEGLLLNLSDSVYEKLAELHSSGIETSIDDFGTGYSSMSYLKRLDIDYLKIDQSFVAEMLQDKTSQTITETIIVMAHKLGLKVIAEGVETKAQRDWLADHDCDYAQGFLFSRPVSADVFGSMLH